MTTAAPLQPTPAHQPAHTPSDYQQSTTTPSSFIDIPRGPVTASLVYFVPPADGSAPYHYVEEPPSGTPRDNYGIARHSVTISDIRGSEPSFTLDKDSFEAISLPRDFISAEQDFTDDAHVKSHYYPEVEKLLLDNVPGAHKVVLFDHTIRRADPNAHRAPVQRVHIDQTPRSTIERVRLHIEDEEEAERLLAGRYRIINVWRPLNGPVVSFPLAVASGSTVHDSDLVGIEHRYPHRTGETAGVKFNEGQKWFYWSGMTNNERLLLKCADSDETVGPVGRVPHTAFEDPRTQQHWPGRESIEVRALVFG